jgi:hypothetical protein
MCFGTQINYRLDHIRRCGIGRRFCAAGLADNEFHFRKAAQDGIACLQVVGHLRDARPWNRHGHVEDGPLIERRHEFTTQRCHLTLGDDGD